jgi:hypothetical protein
MLLGDAEHVEVDMRIFVAGEPDKADLAGLLGGLNGFTGCGKTPDSCLIFPGSGFSRPFGPFCLDFPASFCAWKPFFRPPGTLRP